MKAIIVNKKENNHFKIIEMKSPILTAENVLVEVRSSSINPGDLKTSVSQKTGYVPGWDFAGIVIKEAANGLGPKLGDHVIGILPNGTWQQEISVPISMLAVIPKGLNFDEASTLPIAGLTAFYSIKNGNSLLNKNVLISGSTGSVGYFAHQLAQLSGGNHSGLVRDERKKEEILSLGTQNVYLYAELDKIETKFDLIIDSLGGEYINLFFGMLNSHSSIISVGNTTSDKVTIDYNQLLSSSGKGLERFFLGEEISRRNINSDLQYLADLMMFKKIKTKIQKTVPFTSINEVTQDIFSGNLKGKIILNFK